MEQVKLRHATSKEQRLIKMVLGKTAKIRQLAMEKEELMRELHKLAGETNLVSDMEVDGETEIRTFCLGKPKGKYVMYSTLDFVTNRKISKEEAAALNAVV